jgi:hypothetical protein
VFLAMVVRVVVARQTERGEGQKKEKDKAQLY